MKRRNRRAPLPLLAAACVRLLSLPEADQRRPGLTGLSWGGDLTCIIAGVDHRFNTAVPVYFTQALPGPRRCSLHPAQRLRCAYVAPTLRPPCAPGAQRGRSVVAA